MTTIFIILAAGFLGAPLPTPADVAAAQYRRVPAEKRRSLASQVRTILSQKCVQCHGARLLRPKGKFGNVEDLKRVARDPKLVVPFQPDESKLWQEIRDNEMPPARAKAGPLTVEEKSIIRAWIESGAAIVSEPPASAILPETHTGANEAPERAELPFLELFLGWLGRFHVVIVHFPIALLMVAALGELWSLWRGMREPSPVVRFCVVCAAAGGAAATMLGWLHAAFSGFAGSSSQTLALHRWTGTAAGIFAVSVAVLSEMEARRGVRSPLFRILLFAGALLVGIAGHLGGTLVYGDSFFNW